MPDRVCKLRVHLWTWGPVLGLMAAIFVASAQPKNPPPPDTGSTYFSGLMPVFEGTTETLVKKGSHVGGYALLALALIRAFHRRGHPWRRSVCLAIACAMGYALTDEVHQAFVPGRKPSFLDIGFDGIGAVTAALIANWLLARAEQTNNALLERREEHNNLLPNHQAQGFK